MRVALYARVSSEAQEARGTIGSQLQVLRARIAERGDELVAEAVERTRFGRNGIYDVTVRRGAETVAEFRGRSRTVGSA